MNKYRVNIEYLIPEIADITVDAEYSEAATKLALEEFEANFPEAVEANAVMVTRL